MLRNLNIQARVGAEKGINSCVSLRIPVSMVASAALSLSLFSAGPAHASLIHQWDFLGATDGARVQKSDRSSNVELSATMDMGMALISLTSGSGRHEPFAHYQTSHSADEFEFGFPKVSDSQSPSNGLRSSSVVSLPGWTSPTRDPDVRLITDWHCGWIHPLPDYDPGEVHKGPIIPEFPVVSGGTVPEPSTFLLGIAGLVGVLGRSRRHSP